MPTGCFAQNVNFISVVVLCRGHTLLVFSLVCLNNIVQHSRIYAFTNRLLASEVEDVVTLSLSFPGDSKMLISVACNVLVSRPFVDVF